MIRLAVLGLLLGTSLWALGNAEQQTWTGVVSMKGNMPFTFLALTTEDGSWRLEGPGAESLRREAQGLRVRVFGLSHERTIEVSTWEKLGKPAP